MNFVSWQGQEYYWDGSYWRERAGDRVPAEVTGDLDREFPGEKGEHHWDRVFWYQGKWYWYSEETDKFIDADSFTEPPKEIADELRELLAEPEGEFDNFDDLYEAAIKARDRGEFSKVERLCRISFEKFGVRSKLAAMFCRALRERNRHRETIEFATKYRDRNWQHLLASLAGAQIDVDDLKGAEETIKQLTNPRTIRMLENALHQRRRELEAKDDAGSGEDESGSDKETVMDEQLEKLMPILQEGDLGERILLELIRTLGTNPEAFETFKSCVEIVRELEKNSGSTRPEREDESGSDEDESPDNED